MFVAWLLQQKERKDSIGLLSLSASKDPTLPRGSDKLWIFLHYYRHEPVHRAALKSAHREWRYLNRLQSSTVRRDQLNPSGMQRA